MNKAIRTPSAVNEPTVSDEKKLRNRLSQQAFRRRKNDRIRELEKRLQLPVKQKTCVSMSWKRKMHSFANSSPHSLLSLSLHKLHFEDCRIESIDEISSPKASSKEGSTAKCPFPVYQGVPSVADEIIQLLPATGTPQGEEGIRFTSLPLSTMVLVPPDSQEKCHASFIDNATPVDQESISQRSAALNPCTQFVNPHSMSQRPTLMGNPAEGVPGVWSYNYQMGPFNYACTMADISNFREYTHSTNSIFSDHIHALHVSVRAQWNFSQPSQLAESKLSKLHLSVSLMLSLFNSLNRPLAMSWYTATKFYYHITNLTIWQLCQTRETYMQLPPRYRPSALQLSETYPPIIDWCPFPSLRDKLILLHSANPFIDQIICDIATAYVVETDISKLVAHDCHEIGFIRVWDLIQAMREPSGEQSVRVFNQAVYSKQPFADTSKPRWNTGNLSLPAPDMKSLFKNENFARLAFKELHIDDGISLYKLDPLLFNKYPELFDPEADFIAVGTPIRSSKETEIPVPKILDSATHAVYHLFADWMSNVISSTV